MKRNRTTLFLQFLFISIYFFMTNISAKTIVWVSDAQDSDLDGLPSDQIWVDFLEDAGYEVNYEFGEQMIAGGGYWVELDGDKLAVLEAADLIIIGRATNSGDYATNFDEILDWNLISTPILMQTAYICRNSRWQWLNTGGTLEVVDTLQVLEPDHPIFTDVPMIEENKIAVLDTGWTTANCSFPVISDPGNGMLLAARADTGGVWIVEWEANLEFYYDTDQVPAGKRMYFSLGESGGSDTPEIGYKNTTDAGDLLFLNAVKYMIGDSTGTHIASRNQNELKTFELPQNYPNPFNPVTTIHFSLQKRDFVTLELFNKKGQSVKVLNRNVLDAGTHNFTWNAEGLPSGLYFYRIRTTEFSQTRKMLLMR